jgi:hypothetical protein
MASWELERAFKTAAEKVLNRSVTDQELRRIVEGYERASGGVFDRAIRGIADGTNTSESQVRAKTAGSDDANRVMQDLKTILDQQRP